MLVPLMIAAARRNQALGPGGASAPVLLSLAASAPRDVPLGVDGLPHVAFDLTWTTANPNDADFETRVTMPAALGPDVVLATLPCSASRYTVALGVGSSLTALSNRVSFFQSYTVRLVRKSDGLTVSQRTTSAAFTYSNGF